MSANAAATGLSITNPLVKYRALIATKTIRPDPSQHRLALHLQKLYERLKDYEPEVEYSHRLDQISRAFTAQRRQQHGLASSSSSSSSDNTSISPSPSWRTSGSSSSSSSSWWGRGFLAAKQRRDTLALTRRLTSHESALQLTSPRGLMLHGEVGTGKSMLVDLFADCLPNRKKRRRHFNAFMLETFAKLEALRRSRSGGGGPGSGAAVPGQHDDDDGDEHSLLWLAKDMIQTSPILFLDEFQMPDRVASKILTNLMTSFFQLGGVLVATSNRMPEELAKAAGIAFAPPPQPGWGMSWFGQRKVGMGKGANEFAQFLEVLKARCEVWEMEGGKDYRRMVTAATDVDGKQWETDGQSDYQHSEGMAGWPVDETTVESEKPTEGSELEAGALPPHYCVDVNPSALDESVAKAIGENDLGSVPWSPALMTVYGRAINIPRAYNGVTMWTFRELCKATLGPADYITLASNYHTLILTEVPIMNWMLKNEARRLITLLDALYECRCKLFVSAAAGPDEIFFPEKRKEGLNAETDDAVYPETLAEVYQDATAPFRPNILTQNPNYAEPDPEPDFTHARLAGLLRADSLEDDPPSNAVRSKAAKRNPFGRSFGMTDAELMDREKPVDPDDTKHTSSITRPNFQDTGAFTGQDERFAYKRAQSRLWEMCSARWWARVEAGWHRPLPREVRRWEDTGTENSKSDRESSGSRRGDVRMGAAEVDESRPGESFKWPAAGGR